jgi:hypothetical protein
MYRLISVVSAIAALGVTFPALAGFGAADLIYIPVASHSPGAVGSQWRTDLYVTNVGEEAIDVAIAYLPSGLVNNGPVFESRETWVGGRQEDLFGSVNEELADIPPNGSVVIRDIVGEYWPDAIGVNGNGSLVIMAYEADTLEPDGSRVYRNAISNARIYNETTIWVEDPDNEGDFIERQAEYGQVMPGVPWYNLADAEAKTETFDFSYEVLTGGEDTQNLRYNVGVLNASDPLTTISVLIEPFQANGEPFLDEEGNQVSTLVVMPPASHVQYFRIFTNTWDLEDTEGATVQVSIVNWSSVAATPVVLMTTYGSVIDNRTNDPSTVLPSFAFPYDIDCMWNADGGEKAAAAQRRPIEIPSL